MARTPSTMLPLGTSLPPFELHDSRNELHKSSSAEGAKGVLVAFICNHCPFVIHVRDELAKLGRDCEALGIKIFAISSNDVDNYPQDAPDKMAEEAELAGYTFPYLYDPDQSVAKAYRAACTPDFYLFDKDQKLVYRGQLDDSRPGNGIPVTGNDLRAAVQAVAAGEVPSTDQKPSIGCNIKWKPGGAPEYFG